LFFEGGEEMVEVAIAVKDLKKYYKEVKAVDGVSLEVHRGEVFTLLGPNGAGKTTIIEILEGLKEPDSGTLKILGEDCKKVRASLKDRMGVVLQETRFIDKTKVQEMVEMFASFYSRSLKSEEVLKKVALEEKAEALVENLSGGQRQRLAIGLALINDPDIIFLDEPTTGLDPQARRKIWDLITELREERKTIFLTTHYMEEAEKLSDYIYIMDHGTIIARGTPDQLIDNLDQENVIEFNRESLGEGLEERLREIFPGLQVQEEKVILYVENVTRNFSQLMQFAQKQGVEFENLIFRRPNLEDVFLNLTGKGLRD